MGNTVGKREIARYKQFLLFPQCFQKACFPGASKGVIVWEWVKPSNFILIKPVPHNFKFYKLLMTLDKKPFENIVRKGQNAAKLLRSIFFHNVFYSSQ